MIALLMLLLLGACGQPDEPASLTVEYLDANMPTSATGVWDPNDTITFEIGPNDPLLSDGINPNDPLLIDFVGERDPNADLMVIKKDDEEVCGITRDWVYYRGRAYQDKSCEEYSAVLTETAGLMGWQHYFFGIAICWLMDPCSKE